MSINSQIVIACRYLKNGKRGKTKRRNFTKYIATRESVEKRPQNTGKTTANQKQLIAELIKEFPMAKQYLEYTDYTKNPSSENASELISTIIERHADVIGNRRNFVGYMANRPGAERRGEHGLFNGSDEPIDLNAVANEVAEHPGYVWTHVVSLRREDAVRLGYTNSDMWRELVKRHIDDISKAQNIPLANMKWYAAFHDTTHHPHIHLIVYSSDPRQGYLTKEGMAAIRSAFANDIFHEDMKSIYQEQTLTRDELKALSEDQMSEILSQIGSGVVDERLVIKVRKLNAQLQSVGGKKVYGYLPKEIKQAVDDIFFLLSQNEDIQKLYDKWREFEKAKYKMYTQKDKELPTLVENKEFRSVKNMIIRKVSNMTELPDNESEDIHDDIEEDNDTLFPDELDVESDDTEASSGNYYFKWSNEYKFASRVLKSKDSTDDKKSDALAVMKSEADKGNVLAIHDMGKYTADEGTAQKYYAEALAGFIQVEPQARKMRPYFQYRIGKMYLYGCGTEKAPDTAFKWLEKSAMADNKYAQHTLGNMYCYDIGTEKDLSKAFDVYTKAARKVMPYSDYALAQMYHYGNGVEPNEELAHEHYRKALSAFLMYDKDDKLLYKIGRMYYAGLGTDVDKPKALKYLVESAKQGNIQAKRIVAQEFISGEYIPQDIPRGITMLKECADKGDTSAAYKFGKIYFKGEYMPVDYDKAEKYLSAAVSDNNRDAVYQLAKLYMTAEKYDIKKAIALFDKVADTNMWASYWLGRIYLFGKDGIAPDKEKAVKWLTKSAADGNEYAEKMLNYDGGHSYLISNTIVSLFVGLGRSIEEDNARSRRNISHKVDKKLQRIIQKKKGELGINDDSVEIFYEY